MGERSYVNSSYGRNRRANKPALAGWIDAARSGVNRVQEQVLGSQAKPQRAQAARAATDWVLIGTVGILLLFGLLMVYSAGPQFAAALGLSSDYFLWRQIMWAAVGLVVLLVAAHTPMRWIQRLSVLAMLVTLALLVWTLIVGDTTLNANRSISAGSGRPSELAKLVTIIYVSVWLTAKKDELNRFTLGLFPLIIILGVTSALVLKQPDFSAALTIFILGLMMYFLGGGELRQIFIVGFGAGLVAWLIINFFPTGMNRITEYLDGLRNPLNASPHMRHALEAVVNGGLFGVGIGQSATKFTGLPVAITDSIFAVIVEELGLIGAIGVVTLYVVILWRGLSIANRATDRLGALLAGGITLWIVMEAMLNMAVMVHLLPQAGNALPLVSYGGSNLVITLGAVGIVLNVARTSNRDQSGGRSFGAVVNLRWRDRRRRVSRSGHPADSGR